MSKSKKTNASANPRGYNVATWIGIGLLILGAYWLTHSSKPPISNANPAREPSATPAPFLSKSEVSDATVYAAYAGSASCRECHPAEFAMWQSSHHGLAERGLNPALDKAAFDPAQKIKHGSQTSEARLEQGKYDVLTRGPDGDKKAFAAARVIGVYPLRQFLIGSEGGRYQVLELAYDPNRHDWFDIFGNEDRQPGEWGHWTGRGMTWNAMCATCHNTRLRKHYDPTTDTYATTMAEAGVSCESCHGPMASHNAWQKKNPHSQTKDPTVAHLSRDQMLFACGSCHSRRAELTGEFQAGDNYFDHFTLTIPDDSEVFYPDGQVKEEDYEFTSFLSSKMHAAGVRCVDCHQPHTGKVLLPGNDLCLRCHGAPVPPAPKIDPAAHSHHRLDQAGGLCVNCHMPHTTYMQRHARRDHGFTIPDPLLTKQRGIPNACNRCHQDHDTEWTLAAVDKWYGSRMNRSTRTRAEWVADAREAKADSPAHLITMMQTETNGLWRAVAANLLRHWNDDLTVMPVLLKGTEDRDPLVRAMSARALETLVPANRNDVSAALTKLLTDPARCVRVEAAWADRAKLDNSSLAAQDVLRYLDFNRDQPSGLLQLGSWYLEKGDNATALATFRQAVRLDQGSPPLRHSLAVALDLSGEPEAAIKELETACRLAPREAEYRYKLGLALSEVGRLTDAANALAEAVKLDPQYAQAWYNLGLAYAKLQQLDKAADALGKAEALNQRAPQFPYALATVLLQQGKNAEARNALLRALSLQPNYPDALNLLRSISSQ